MMPCVTHYCISCDYEWFNNKPRDSCPFCCRVGIAQFDEVHDEPEKEDE